MSTVEYDLDVSGGLMPQVQALIAPPVSEDDTKAKKPGKGAEHPYFKRPGKGHNHDICDACSEGGDLICCDKCPASFHLTCHDPPLDEGDIPAGKWLCHHCRKTKELQGDRPQQRTKRSNSSTAPASPPKLKRPKTNPLEVLVKAASMLNPRQFELPRSMNEPCLFPGTDKVEILCNKSRKGVKGASTKKGGSDSSGTGSSTGSSSTVPLPAKKCFECRRSCRVGPLLACDYCPLLFHLDCLDPPLTALPTARWMCPNHVEQYIDSKLVTSSSATERIRLWDKFASGPVDQDAIKTDFFRRVHCQNPPFRVKVRLSTRKRVKVPEMVRYHYQNPVALLPSLRDVLRLTALLSRSRSPPASPTTPPAHIVVTDRCNGQVSPSPGPASEPVEDLTESLPLTESALNGQTTWSNGQGGPSSEVLNGTCNNTDTKLPDVVTGIVHSDIERELKQLDDRLVRLLAYQRIQQLVAQAEGAGSARDLGTLITSTLLQQQPTRTTSGPGSTKHLPLPSQLLTAADIDRISRVFTSPKKGGGSTSRPSRSRNAIRARAILCPVVSKHFYNVRSSEVCAGDVRHDASFMGFRPTVSARFPEAAAMRYRAMSIGKGSANDVELERFGHCNYTSAKHAVIFFDECSKHYELINYSEYGTQVNNVLYSFDFSDKQEPKDPDNPSSAAAPSTTTSSPPVASKQKEDKAAIVVAAVREIVDKKRGVQRQKPPSIGDGRMTAVAADGYESLECCCNPNSLPSDLKTGWEGTAILSHGSLIKFGCISFVFSIVECASV